MNQKETAFTGGTNVDESHLFTTEIRTKLEIYQRLADERISNGHFDPEADQREAKETEAELERAKEIVDQQLCHA